MRGPFWQVVEAVFGGFPLIWFPSAVLRINSRLTMSERAKTGWADGEAATGRGQGNHESCPYKCWDRGVGLEGEDEEDGDDGEG